ncbi:MAG: sulfotransferase [Fidelibacterota bacterium]|nr:MAG: sulfotransferase [Candidatus Neomarinimicrobiota bacterium]
MSIQLTINMSGRMPGVNREYLVTLKDYLVRCRQMLPFSGFPLSRGEAFEPFFIIGSGRSGTTLLRRILTSHQELHIPPESYVLAPVIRQYRQLRNAQWQALVHLVLARFEYHPEFTHFGITLRSLVEELERLPRRERSLAQIINRVYAYHATSSGKPGARWGDKTPINTFYLDRIQKVFPKATFIHILRDGCDCIASMVKQGRYSNLDDAIQRWKQAVQIAHNFVRSNQEIALEIRYESLVSDPETTISDVCSFLDVEYFSGLISSVEIAAQMGDVVSHAHHERVQKPISTESIGRGRRDLKIEERERIQQLIGPVLESFGYDPCI